MVCVYIGGFKEYEALLAFRNKLIHTLSLKNVFTQVVSAEIITTRENEEIANIDDLKEKVSFLIKSIMKSLEVGVTQKFYLLLNIMEGCGSDTAMAAEEIKNYVVHYEYAGINFLFYIHCRITYYPSLKVYMKW